MLGKIEGTLEGSKDGIELGKVVGFFDGTMVGLRLGVTDGVLLGGALGDALGVVDGTRVGLRLGVTDGAKQVGVFKTALNESAELFMSKNLIPTSLAVSSTLKMKLPDQPPVLEKETTSEVADSKSLSGPLRVESEVLALVQAMLLLFESTYKPPPLYISTFRQNKNCGTLK